MKDSHASLYLFRAVPAFELAISQAIFIWRLGAWLWLPWLSIHEGRWLLACWLVKSYLRGGWGPRTVVVVSKPGARRRRPQFMAPERRPIG
jgi:hypothetical protein